MIMKTSIYNPSLIELEFSKAFASMQEELQKKLPGYKIVKMECHDKKDNPDVVIQMTDLDRDRHELLVMFIQRADQ